MNRLRLSHRAVLTAALVAVGMLCWSGCKSPATSNKTSAGTQATKPASAPGKSTSAASNAAVDPVRLTQLLNIVSNRGIRAVPAELNQLAELKPPGAFEAISPGLSDERLLVRMYCATALGTLGDQRALPLLRKALKSKYSGLQLAAVVGLGNLGPTARPAAGDLAAMLNQRFEPMHPSVQHLRPDDDVDSTRTITQRIHLAVLKSLGQIGGPDAQKTVAEALGSSANTEIEWQAARALKAMGAADALMSAGDAGKTSAWRMLAEMKHTDALKGMLQYAADASIAEPSRCEAIYALGVMQDRGATPLLLNLLGGKSPKLAAAAAWSLNNIADPESFPALLQYVTSAPKDAPGLYSATCAIGAIGSPEASDALRKLGNHPSSTVREAVAYRLDEKAQTSDLPLLIDLLSDSRDVGHFPTKALTRLLPESANPLLTLLPTAKPELQVKIAGILIKHEPARPALRELLKSSNQMVRNSVRNFLWEQRDSSVPLEGFLNKNESPSGPLDKRDLTELKRLAASGSDDDQTLLTLAGLFHVSPQDAWPRIKPLFSSDDLSAVLRAKNAMGRDYPDWIQREMLDMLDKPEGLSRHGKRMLLEMLCEADCISPQAIALYRRYADDQDYEVRGQACHCLWQEASDESMALIADKALGGDERAKYFIGGHPDKRFADTFAKLVAQAIEKKETWLGGYTATWPMAPGIEKYASEVGSQYGPHMLGERRTILETAPD